MVNIAGALEGPPDFQEEAVRDAELAVKNEWVQSLPVLVRSPPEEVEVQVPPEEVAASQIKQTAGVDGRAESLMEDRCRAMMEVVLKENGRWSISKLETEHNHSLNTSSHCDDRDKMALSIGMVFESVVAAGDFYSDYSDKIGFKALTGSNRRSEGTGALIMQRFLCYRGSNPLQKCNLETSIGKRKRGPYNKRGKLLEEEEKDGDGYSVEVVDVDSSAEKGGVTGEYLEAEVESRPSRKSSEGGVFGTELESRDSVISTTSFEATTVAAADAKVCGQPTPTSVSQSKILRELGVRVYRYSSDEKRDIILRYLMKKNNRHSGERTIKFFTTQPPPGENFRQQSTQQQKKNSHQQNGRGKSIGRVQLQAREKQDKVVTRKPKPPIIEITGVVEEPKIGMLFVNEDRAYEFYVRYAGNIGFCVRKGWWDKTSRSVTRLRVYVCSKEGFRPKISANEMKKARPETRTGCPARMAINLTSNGKYSVSEFVSEHNHDLAVPLDIQMFKSQKLAKVQFNHYRTRLIPAEYKNYLRLKRIKSMQMGDAGAILEYLQRMKGENASFFYAIQVDEDDLLTNIFWADANSIMDYDYFGDVVCFDTTYKDAECGRPFVQFIGVNHHKQAVFFGAAVLYDETVESFKWLFEAFKGAMGGKQPKTILTGQSSIMSDAIAAVWPGTVHRYCVWNIYQSAAKNLSQVFKETVTFSLDLNQCIFELFEEEDFLTAWTSLLERYDLKGNEWLANLYEQRKSWALPYVQDAFYADIFNTLRREGVNSMLKEYLNSEIDFLQFLKKYDEYVKDRRYMEQEADYLTSQVMSRASMVRVMWQAANLYTHAAFEMFKMEFELLSNCLVYSCGEVGTVSEYEVAVKDKSKLYFVRFDISDGSVFCNCKKFEFVGILCCHVLRVLDCRNVKDLAPQYFLKRWRKDAKSGLVRGDEGFPLQDDPKSSLQKRYSSLCRILYKLAARAAENVHAYAFMENQSDQILEQIERILQTKFLEETSMNTSSKGQSQSQIQGEGIDNGSNSESRILGGRKKKDVNGRRRKQNGMEVNKRYKGLKGKSDAVEISLDASDPPLTSNEFPPHARNSSNQFFPQNQSVQGPYIPGHQFGLGSFQGFHGTPQFTQEFSAPVLQQQPFAGEAHLGQMCSVHDKSVFQAPEIHHALQFVASNSQLGPPGGDQGHYTIPVWDFL